MRTSRTPVAVVRFLRAASVAGLLLLRAVPAAAQEPLAAVQRAVRPGDTVLVLDDTRLETRGRVVSVGSSAIRLRADGIEREWQAERIWRITREGDSKKNGALIGMSVGGALGVVGGLAWASLLSNEGHDPLGGFLSVLALGLGGGAGVGAGCDALIQGRTVVYQSKRTVTFAPVVTPRARGLQVSVSF
jgi:hypothetical protein